MNPSALIVTSLIAALPLALGAVVTRAETAVPVLVWDFDAVPPGTFPSEFSMELCLTEGLQAIGKSSRLIEPRVPHMYSPSSWPREPRMLTKWC